MLHNKKKRLLSRHHLDQEQLAKPATSDGFHDIVTALRMRIDTIIEAELADLH